MKRIEQKNGKNMDCSTIYKCCQKGKPDHCEKTEVLAVKWLKENGGGSYKNVLHGFEFYVKGN